MNEQETATRVDYLVNEAILAASRGETMQQWREKLDPDDLALTEQVTIRMGWANGIAAVGTWIFEYLAHTFPALRPAVTQEIERRAEAGEQNKSGPP